MTALQSMTEGQSPLPPVCGDQLPLHTPPIRSFASVVTANQTPTAAQRSFADVPVLQYPIGHYRGAPSVHFTEDQYLKLAQPLTFSLVGKFSRGRPSMDTLRKDFDLIGFKCPVSLGLMDQRHILIRFSSEEDYHRCWLKGVWNFQGFSMRLFKWTPDFNLQQESSIAPVWVGFPRLPIHLFQKGPLLSIGRSIGLPLKVDAATVSLARPSIARVCIEVDVAKSLPDKFWIGIGEKGFWQPVEYEALPGYCTLCNKLGHAAEDCNSQRGKEIAISEGKEKEKGGKLTQIYKPVAKPSTAITDDTAKGKVVAASSTDPEPSGVNSPLMTPNIHAPAVTLLNSPTIDNAIHRPQATTEPRPENLSASVPIVPPRVTGSCPADHSIVVHLEAPSAAIMNSPMTGPHFSALDGPDAAKTHPLLVHVDSVAVEKEFAPSATEKVSASPKQQNSPDVSAQPLLPTADDTTAISLVRPSSVVQQESQTAANELIDSITNKVASATAVVAAIASAPECLQTSTEPAVVLPSQNMEKSTVTVNVQPCLTVDVYGQENEVPAAAVFLRHDANNTSPRVLTLSQEEIGNTVQDEITETTTTIIEELGDRGVVVDDRTIDNNVSVGDDKIFPPQDAIYVRGVTSTQPFAEILQSLKESKKSLDSKFDKITEAGKKMAVSERDQLERNSETLKETTSKQYMQPQRQEDNVDQRQEDNIDQSEDDDFTQEPDDFIPVISKKSRRRKDYSFSKITMQTRQLPRKDYSKLASSQIRY